MPIQATCPSCQKTLRVGDQHAGKKARCPHCQGVVEIPAGGGASGVGAGAATGAGSAAVWHVQTPEDRFGPITKAELDKWAAERRIDAQCQVWCEGWPEWKFAPEVYPHLAAQAATQISAPAGPAFGGMNLGGPPALPGGGFAVNTGGAPAFGSPYSSPQTSSYGGGGDDGASPATRRIMGQMTVWIMISAIGGFVLGVLLLLAAIDSFRIYSRISEFDPPASVTAALLLAALGYLSLCATFLGGGVFLLVFSTKVSIAARTTVRPASLFGPLKSYFGYLAISTLIATVCLGIARIIAYSVGGDAGSLF